MSEQMECTIDDKDERGVGRCACSLIMAMRGVCKVYGPPPTFAEAFPYLAPGADS
jgi:hypothetical protein